MASPQLTAPLEAERAANPLSWATWSYLGPLLAKGYKVPLEQEDMGAIPDYDSSSVLVNRLRAGINNARGTGAQRLMRTIATWDLGPMVFAGVCKLLGDLIGFVGPVALSGIVSFVAKRARGESDVIWWGMELGYWWLIAAVLAAVLQNWLLHLHHGAVMRAGYRIRSAVGTLVYRKSIKLDGAKLAEIGSGRVQNMQTNDANAINMMFWFIHYTWAAPVQLAICMAMLYGQLGPSCFVGLGVCILLIPLQTRLGAAMAHYGKLASGFSDARIKLINEMVNGIRIIKYFAYEETFRERITAARDAELRTKWQVAVVNAVNMTAISTGPFIVSLLTFLTYGFVSSTPITASVAFTSITLFGILRLPMMVLPMLSSGLSSAYVSIMRVGEFLDAPDMVDYRTLVAHDDRDDVDAASKPTTEVRAADVAVRIGKSDAAIELRGATLRWPVASKPPAPAAKAGTNEKAASASAAPASSAHVADAFELHDLNVVIPRGKLTSVVGAVGSGKSSLLEACLGDMTLERGSVTIHAPHELVAAHGKEGAAPIIAYCSQQAWIQNASVRDNITFGLDFSASHYDAVLDACALRPDIAILPAGDATEIGERGVNLSGGQKARIALARAVYSACPIVILDDVLSAVDAHVGRHIFDHAIRGMLRGRSILMATHQLQFVAQSDMVVVLEAGRVSECGTYADLMNNGSAHNLLREMMQERHRIDDSLSASAAITSASAGVVGTDAVSVAAPASPTTPTLSVSVATSPVGTLTSPLSPGAVMASKEASKDSKAKDGKLIEAEDRNRGSVPAGVYWLYLSAMGMTALTFMLLSLFIMTAGGIGTDWWLGLWSTGTGGFSTGYYIGVYAAITLATALVTLLFSVTWAYGSLFASRGLHASMLARVLRSPMSFFDTTPAGRILNRFSGDIETVDRNVPSSFSSYISSLFRVLSSIVIQAIILPYTLLGTVPVAFVYAGVQTYYRASMREVKRLDNISRSPVFAHLAETLTGLPTLRSYAALKRCTNTSEARMDANQLPLIALMLLNRWLGLRLDMIGAVLVGVTCLVSVLTAGTVNAGLVGLAISYAMAVTGNLNWVVRNATETESYLACVERADHYARLPVERPPIIDTNRPAPAWPSRGEITFNNLTVRYRADLDPVLRGVSLRIAAGEKVGVCGRTGAGKSSTMLALYRILEAEAGSIVLDGVDISTIGLDDLRSRLAIIPQDPVLFAGTLRYNLDVTTSHTDEEVWSALERVQMKSKVEVLEGGLNARVAENGDNFSVGERQLLCTARALLRRAKVVVMDEATASTDVLSDSVMQRMLRTDFPGVTMLIIAHRINTIIDCDKILVLDGGQVAEFASPTELLARPDSMFASLVRESASSGQ